MGRQSSKQSTLTDQLRERNKILRQRERQPMTDAQRAEKLELILRLARNTLTRSQRQHLVNELFSFWFAKEWAAHLRAFDRQEKADICRLLIRLKKPKTGGLSNDAKQDVVKALGLQSVEA